VRLRGNRSILVENDLLVEGHARQLGGDGADLLGLDPATRSATASGA
jgi:hypothetical protein